MIAAVLSIVINMIVEVEHRNIAWIEGFAILMAVFVSSSVQGLTNYQNENEFIKLNEEAESKKTVKIIRDGIVKDIRLTHCLVGDLIVIRAGDEIAGDGVILEAHSVGVNESAMTGETEIMDKASLAECVRKRDVFLAEEKKGDHLEMLNRIHEIPSPILVSGTSFIQGSGLMIVICVGMNSAIGRIKKTVIDNATKKRHCRRSLKI